MADTTGMNPRTKEIVNEAGDSADAVAAMSDVAKQRAREAAAKQNLKTAFNGQPSQPGQMVTSQQLSPEAQVGLLQQQIAEAENQAQNVQRSGTGNMRAYQTYMQIAQQLRQRLATLQGGPGMAAAAKGQPQPTSQPTSAPAQNAAAPAGGNLVQPSPVQPNNATPGAGQ